MTRGIGSRVRDLALLVGGIVIALVVVEVGLRVAQFSYVSFFRPDDRLGLRLRENAEGWYRSEGEAFVRINSAGFRDRERSIAKPPDVYRIAVLGDSYAEALQVDLEKTFQVLLERRLNECKAFGGKRVEVLNFGVSSYGTAQQLLMFRHVASKYSPDLVLAAFFAGNDVRNNARELEPDKVRPFFVLQGESLIEDRSFADSDEFRRRTNRLRAVLDELRVLRIVQAAYFVKDRLQQQEAQRQPPGGGSALEAGLDDAVYGEPPSPQWRAAWTVTERILAQLRDEVKAANAELVIISLSTGMQVHPDPQARARLMETRRIADLFYPDRRVQQMAAALNVRTIVLAPRLQQIAEREKVFLHGFDNTRLGTGHWNENGHRFAAELIAADLCGEPAETRSASQ
jgi:hypothetical protein